MPLSYIELLSLCCGKSLFAPKLQCKLNKIGFKVTLIKANDVTWSQFIMKDISWIYAEQHGIGGYDSQSKGLEVNLNGRVNKLTVRMK